MEPTLTHKAITIQFDIGLWKRLEKHALDEKSSVARIVRLACDDFLRRRGCEVTEPESR